MPWEFRSDTFTRPTEAMRRVMATAEVGDDVWGEDPTVIALEERAAAAVGKEAAVFVPSGTMGNAIGMRLHAGQGDALWAHDSSHVIDNEGGGPATLWGILPRGIATGGGFFGAGELRELVPEDDSDHHHAIARLVCVENTSTAAQGAPWPLDQLAEIRSFAHGRGMKVHMDGARLFNAAVALGVGADVICREVDTIQFCLSKGLGAPVGSIIAGTREEMVRADRYRKLLGGGMRQAGIVAAAGIHALDHHVERLADDHANARRLAEGIAAGSRLEADPAEVPTNIVLAACTRDSDTAAGVCDELAAVGVMAAPYDRTRIRFVTSLEVDAAGVEAALEAAVRVIG
jgi:threonine aldolase